MANKRTKQLRELSQTELTVQLRDTEMKLFQARMQKATGQLTNTASLWGFRKDIARIKTLQKEAQRSGAKA